ncbi:MAG: hypothetical protein U0802_22885 [Candidatus Binatia bacterium]
MNADSAPARAPKRSTIAASTRRRRSSGSRASTRSATGPKVKDASTPGLPPAGEASSVTSDADWAPADWPLKPSARQNGSS